jgi:carboxyl-terminal processing protease
MRRAVLLPGLALLLTAAFAVGYVISGRNTPPPRTPAVDVVDAVRAELAARYYRPVPEKVLRLRSVESILGALGDPYTEYLDQPQYRLLQRRLAGTYTGIGATLLPSSDGFLVVSTQPGPAQEAGIRAGDEILRIGAAQARGLGLEGALTRISGPRGTVVRLVFERRNRVLRVSVKRAPVQAVNVTGRVVASRGTPYGYIRIESFASGTVHALSVQVRQLQRLHVGGLVLDLRGNPGGLLGEAVRTASLFLRRGIVVSIEGAHQPRDTYSVSGRPVAPRLPLVVLVDRYSASSAEVLAAALHDNRRARVVGENTYGKAVVQSIDPLANGGALALTTARYYTPAGADISSVGVRPDVRVRESASRADAALAAGLASLGAATS